MADEYEGLHGVDVILSGPSDMTELTEYLQMRTPWKRGPKPAKTSAQQMAVSA